MVSKDIARQRLVFSLSRDSITDSTWLPHSRRDAAEAAEDTRRKAEVSAKKAALQAALSAQLAERAASKQQASAAQREKLAAINQSIQARPLFDSLSVWFPSRRCGCLQGRCRLKLLVTGHVCKSLGGSRWEVRHLRKREH